MEPLKNTTHNLSYCGDGQVETIGGDNERQVAAVVGALVAGPRFSVRVM